MRYATKSPMHLGVKSEQRSGGSTGAVWGNCTLRTSVAPLCQNAPLFCVHGSRNRLKNTLK